MPTIKEIANACGVSKPTVKSRLREIGMWEGHVRKEGQAFVVSDMAASAVASALGAESAPNVAPAAGGSTVTDLYERHIALLEADKARLEAQVAEKDREIADLSRQIAEIAGKLAESRRRPSFWDRLLPSRSGD